jgi:asparagine synthase (glutamine-hydrolysing)
MCGICGKLEFDPGKKVSPELVRAMGDTIRHRGPDDDGYFVADSVGFGFRRLSIIDLAAGHQPLANEDGSVWIVFNGEIYNYQELRELAIGKGHQFKTHSDTEVIVHLYEEFGIDCLQKLRGMFAFAIWDGRTKSLLLARDRVGIKPLYFHKSESAIVFASEIKAILADPSVRREMVPDLIDRFFTFLYMPGDETLLKGVRKLEPGHYLLAKDGKVTIRQYWDLRVGDRSKDTNAGDAEAQLIELLQEAVGMHMIADVPVGVLLSGGVDSTGVLSLAAASTDKQISTFTVGFAGSEVADERPYAAIAAQRFGTRHYDMTISAADFGAFLPRYIWHMEEPVCEPPAIALYYVSKLARDHVTVLLSGEGGDEAFAGYSNYRNLVWLERFKSGVPALNGAFSRGLSLIDAVLGSKRFSKYGRLMVQSFPEYYCSRTYDPSNTARNGLRRIYSKEFDLLVNRERSLLPIRKLQDHVRGQETLDAMLYIDTKTWLPDDLLIKADKMTMANSIELRVPLLDHRILEFAASLQPNLKLNGGNTKYILKKALSSRIPKEIRDRKKTGFPVPYASWLRSDLKGLVSDVLMDRRTTDRGYFSKEEIERLLRSNSENGQYSKEVFSLLSLELWQRAFLENEQVVLR